MAKTHLINIYIKIIGRECCFMFKINEAKLSTGERKTLNDDKFGIPSLRKYPLTDSAHVTKAIQFFKFCPMVNRVELATNINKKIKEYAMTVNVSKDNPFHKLADRYNGNIILEASLGILNTCLTSTITDDASLLREEKRIHDQLKNDGISMETLKEVNGELTVLYKNFHDYKKYEKMNHDILSQLYMSSVFGTLKFSLESNTSMVILDHLYELTQNNSVNYYQVYRELREFYNMIKTSSIDTNDEILSKCNTILDNLTEENSSLMEWNIDILNNNNMKSIDFTPLVEYLEAQKSELEKEIYIIKEASCLNNVSNTQLDSIFENLQYSINPDFINRVLKEEYSTNLNGTDIIKAMSIKDYKYIKEGFDINSDIIYFGVNMNGGISLLLKDIVNENIMYSIPIDDDRKTSVLCESVSAPTDFKILRYDFSKLENNATLNMNITEGISVDADGNLKFAFSPKKTYMDEYAENHKLLMENWKNKNYSGVKENLAFAFTAINILERSSKFKKKDTEIINARSFFINDFKTYLKKLQEVEPDFNFADFYKKGEYDKFIIDIPHESIAGISKIVKALLL